MRGTTFKRCGCRQNGKPLGTRCPKLKRRNGTWNPEHGVWHLQVELPPRPDGRRRTLRRGGFASQRDADAQLDRIRALLTVPDATDPAAQHQIADLIERSLHGRPLPTTDEVRQRLRAATPLHALPTVGEWLDQWLVDRARKIKKSTQYHYRTHTRLWLRPHLGHRRIDQLTIGHITDLFDAMEERNDQIRAARASFDPAVRDTVKGLKLMGGATLNRYRATLRAALNAAIRAQLITFNPASFVELPSGKRPKALLWTDERVRRWQATGQVPSAVMVWTPEQTGQFLDHAADDPLYPLFHLIALRGLRRGEACGLHWADVDLDRAELTVTTQIVQIGWTPEFDTPKSDASGRTIALDADTTRVLRVHRKQQYEARLAHGPTWNARGLVSTDSNGEPLHPASVTDRFKQLAADAGLPPIRLHDLRHGAATLTLATGADLKVVQDLLGHSSITITADTYAHVLPELARDTAEAAAALVPRRRRPG